MQCPLLLQSGQRSPNYFFLHLLRAVLYLNLIPRNARTLRPHYRYLVTQQKDDPQS